MRTSAWVMILGLVGLAVACGDQPTEVVPDRAGEAGQQVGRPGTVALATASSGDGYSITTDKDDYQPGDVVHFAGAGWEPDDVLDIVLTDEPQTHPPHAWNVTVGADGTFTDDTYTVDEGDLDVTFTLVATSRSNGQSLAMTFTDGNLQGVTLTPANVFVQPTGTASTAIDVTIGGSGTDCTVTLNLLSTPALPAGVNASITPNNSQTGAANFSRTLTFTTGSVTPGSYPFTVRAVRGANCQGNGNVEVTGNLVVFGAAAKLVFGQQPSNTPGGGTITPAVSVRVLDGNNNLVANSNADIQMAIQNNAGAGTLRGTLTLAAVGGVATFNDLSIDKIGTAYTLRATSGALTGIISTNFNITLGAAARLGFTVQPTGASPNAALGTQPRVAVLDAGGNIRNTGPGSGAPITLAVTPGTGSGTLSCTVDPVNASNGVATFAGCTINLAGSGYTLRATSPGLRLADSDPFDIVNADASAPTVSCTPPDPNLWYGDNVNVPCTAADGSGLAHPASDASFTLSTSVPANAETSTASTGNRSVCDALDNCAPVGPFVFKVDRKTPVVTCASADGEWHAGDASVHCTAADGGSGVTPGDEGFDLTTSVAANSETANASTGSRKVTDLVGNDVTAGPVTGNKVDKKAPQFTCEAAPGDWSADDVARDCVAVDGGSGLAPSTDASFQLTTTVAANTETDDAQTGSRELADAVGNTKTAGPLGGNKVDKKSPEVSCGSADGLWHANDVSIGCTASDGGSGLADDGDASFNLNTSVAAGTETANASTNSRYVVDDVGNSATAGPVGGNQIDRKGPTLSLTCPNAPILLNQPVSATWLASDGGSGVATGFLTGGFPVPTNTVGPHTATAVAGLSRDNVGNPSTASGSCGYGVNYGFAGFLTPVDPNPAMNGANSGQAIPLKWTLRDYNGNPVTTLASVTVNAVGLSCSQGTTSDQIEEYAAGASGLINKGDGSYQFNWKTPTSYAKSCKTLQLNLGDGGPAKIALFEFKK